MIDAYGDKHLDAYTKKDANAFRDSLINRGLAGTSLTMLFGTVRSVTNFAASELGLHLKNPFPGVYCDSTAGVSDRNRSEAGRPMVWALDTAQATPWRS